MNFIGALLVFLVNQFHTPVYANSALRLDGYKGETSDHIWINEAKLRYEQTQADLLWPYSYQETDFWSHSFEFQHLEIMSPRTSLNSHLLMARHRYFDDHNNMFGIEWGGYHIDPLVAETYQALKATALYQHHWENTLFIDLTLGQGLQIPRLIPLGGKTQDFYGTQASAVILYRPHSSWDLTYRHTSLFLADNNQGNRHDAQLMYAITRFPHWILLGWGLENFSYQQPSTSYWAPRTFFSHGPRLDMNMELAPQWFAFLGGSFNFFKENNFQPGDGFYGRGGISYGSRDHHNFQVYYEKVQSTQNGRIWESDAAGATVEWVW